MYIWRQALTGKQVVDLACLFLLLPTRGPRRQPCAGPPGHGPAPGPGPGPGAALYLASWAVQSPLEQQPRGPGGVRFLLRKASSTAWPGAHRPPSTASEAGRARRDKDKAGARVAIKVWGASVLPSFPPSLSSPSSCPPLRSPSTTSLPQVRRIFISVTSSHLLLPSCLLSSQPSALSPPSFLSPLLWTCSPPVTLCSSGSRLVRRPHRPSCLQTYHLSSTAPHSHTA